MRKKTQETEDKIFFSARKEFMEKGIDGARMQKIADDADINKALLHYYFKTKDDLFKAVFDRELAQLFELLGQIIQSSKTLLEKLEGTVDIYYDFLEKNPHAINFVIQAINRNPKVLTRKLKSKGVNIQLLLVDYEEAKAKSLVPDIDFVQFFTSWIGMLVFPFIAAPIITEIIFEGKKTAFKQFIQERKSFLKSFLKLMEVNLPKQPLIND